MNQRTRVIVVNYNAGDALLRCAATVLASREPLHLIVADNASTDGSCERLRSHFAGSQRLEILENGTNLGFARAVNACARAAPEPYLLILNPDCELFPDTLSRLRQALENDSQAALAGPCIVDRNGKVLRGTYRRFPSPWRALVTGTGLWRLGRWFPRFLGVEPGAQSLPGETIRAEAVTGACMLVRTADFQRLGGFDEAFEMHFEDLDLMRRLAQGGRRCLYVPAARAFHQPGTSSQSRRWWVHRQKHAGLQRYLEKNVWHHRPGPVYRLCVAGIWLHWLLTLPRVWLRR